MPFQPAPTPSVDPATQATTVSSVRKASGDVFMRGYTATGSWIQSHGLMIIVVLTALASICFFFVPLFGGPDKKQEKKRRAEQRD